MRKVLSDPPKRFRHELIGTLIRATLNECWDVRPFDFNPRDPHYCPVCGLEADLTPNRASTVLSLEFEEGTHYEFVVWTHADCFLKCDEVDEPPAELE